MTANKMTFLGKEVDQGKLEEILKDEGLPTDLDTTQIKRNNYNLVLLAARYTGEVINALGYGPTRNIDYAMGVILCDLKRKNEPWEVIFPGYDQALKDAVKEAGFENADELRKYFERIYDENVPKEEAPLREMIAGMFKTQERMFLDVYKPVKAAIEKKYMLLHTCAGGQVQITNAIHGLMQKIEKLEKNQIEQEVK